MKYAALIGLLVVAGTLTVAYHNRKAAAIFNRHFEVTGGRNALERIQTVTVTGSLQEGEQKSNVEIHLKVPGKILMTAVNAEGLTVRQGRDNDARCWREDSLGLRELNGQEAGELMELTSAFFPMTHLFWSKMLTKAACSEELDGARTVLAVGSKPDTGSFPRVLFDKQSGQLVGIGEVRLEDYRTVGSIQLPYVVRAEPRTTIQVKEITLNPALADSVFDRP